MNTTPSDGQPDLGKEVAKAKRQVNRLMEQLGYLVSLSVDDETLYDVIRPLIRFYHELNNTHGGF